MKSIHKLLSTTNPLSVNVCLVNMPQNCYIMLNESDIEDIFSKINRYNVFLTYDTSHFFMCDDNVNIYGKNILN